MVRLRWVRISVAVVALVCTVTASGRVGRSRRRELLRPRRHAPSTALRCRSSGPHLLERRSPLIAPGLSSGASILGYGSEPAPRH